MQLNNLNFKIQDDIQISNNVDKSTYPQKPPRLLKTAQSVDSTSKKIINKSDKLISNFDNFTIIPIHNLPSSENSSIDNFYSKNSQFILSKFSKKITDKFSKNKSKSVDQLFQNDNFIDPLTLNRLQKAGMNIEDIKNGYNYFNKYVKPQIDFSDDLINLKNENKKLSQSLMKESNELGNLLKDKNGDLKNISLIKENINKINEEINLNNVSIKFLEKNIENNAMKIFEVINEIPVEISSSLFKVIMNELSMIEEQINQLPSEFIGPEKDKLSNNFENFMGLSALFLESKNSNKILKKVCIDLTNQLKKNDLNINKQLISYTIKAFNGKLSSFQTQQEKLIKHLFNKDFEHPFSNDGNLAEKLGIKAKKIIESKNIESKENLKNEKKENSNSIDTSKVDKSTDIDINELIDFVSPSEKYTSAMQQLEGMNIREAGQGIYLSNMDANHISGGIIRLAKRVYNNSESQFVMDFKITENTRSNMEKLINFIQSDSVKINNHLKEHGICQGVQIEKSTYYYEGFEEQDNVFSPALAMGKSTKITFQDLGTIEICDNDKSEKGMEAMRRLVTIKTNPNLKNSDEVGVGISKMLQFIMLGSGTQESTQENQDKLKIAHLFRTYYPKEATEIETHSDFARATVEELKELIIKSKPEMQEIFDEIPLNQIEMQELEQGRFVPKIPHIDQKVRAAGGRALMMGIGGKDIESAGNSLVMIMKNGALSSQDRFQKGIIKAGASSEKDHRTGGADHVYTRMLHDMMIDNNEIPIKKQGNVDNFPFAGKIQILYDLETLNLSGGIYAYPIDQFGTKKGDKYLGDLYKNRNNLIEFTKNLPKFGTAVNNEVMIKNSIAPSHIKGLVVQTEADRDYIINLIKNDSSNNSLLQDNKFNGVPLEDLIFVGNNFSSDMIKNC